MGLTGVGVWGWSGVVGSPGWDSFIFIPAPALPHPQSSLHQENVTVFGCLTHEVPLSLGDAAVTCSKGEDEEWGEERWLAVRRKGEDGWEMLWREDGLGPGAGIGGTWVRVL